jgi:hypothetical protein
MKIVGAARSNTSSDALKKEKPPTDSSSVVQLSQRLKTIPKRMSLHQTQGAPLTALDIVRKVAHEGGHHLLDIGRSLRAGRERPSQP